MKKLSSLFFLLIIAVLVGAGCAPATDTTVDQVPDDNEPLVIDPPQDNNDNLPAGWSQYSNADVGIAFNYPTAWGEPTVSEEEGQENEDYNGCIYSRSITFPEVTDGGANLITAVGSGDCKAPGRGAQWSDQGAALTANTDYQARCEEGDDHVVADDCETLDTEGGERVWHWHYNSYPLLPSDVVLENVDEYALYHPGHELTGVVISNQVLVDNDAADQSDNLRGVVESITFVD